MKTYIVRSGDTFGIIAKNSNTTIADLKNLNPQISDINRISVGQIINLPDPSVATLIVNTLPPTPSSTITSFTVTPAQLQAIIRTLPLPRAIELCGPLNQAMQEFSINTPMRISIFLAQIAHESGGLSTFVENLNYHTAGLLKTFPKYFTVATAPQYARNPQKIASKTYANRMGNGDEASGDGWRYRGRGVIQLTGKNNYQACGSALKLDLIKNPELLEEPLNAFRSACWFWTSRNLNTLADAGDFISITRKINGGINGLQERQNYWVAAKRVLEVK